MAYQNGKWINNGLAPNNGVRARAREFLGRHAPGKLSRINLVTVLIACVLVALVLITGVFYMSRISNVAKTDSNKDNSSDPAYGQLNPDLAAPVGISVTVNKGATVKWQGENDSRVLGYNVYRFTGEDDSASQINAAIVSDTVYFDDEGTMFNSYGVAPVDTNGRQGAISARIAASAEPSSLATLTPTRAPEQIEDFTFEKDAPQTGLPADTIPCNGQGMTYIGVWYLEHYVEVTGGNLMVTPSYGDSCSYSFVGDSVTVIATRHWNYGIMAIYMDGELRQEVDLYSAAIRVKDRVFTASGLGAGVHTIKLTCTGRKNPQANFTFINIEALEIK